MFALSPRSPLVLPWGTLRLVVRYALPLAFWFTVGEALRYAVLYGGYRLGGQKGALAAVVPMAAVSLLVLISLAVTVLMIHCVREGLHVVHARGESGDLTPWAVGNDETVLGAMGRAAVPFAVFYLAWGINVEDIREFGTEAASRGLTEQGLEGQTKGLAMLLSLDRHVVIAVVITVVFLVAKLLTEWRLEERLPRAAALLLAFLEVNFALFAIFSIDQVRKAVGDWITERALWEWITGALGGALELWDPFKHAVLGGLIWLVIAGVILGLDARDHDVVFGQSRAGRRLARASGVGGQGGVREYLTRGLRDLWVPAWYGLRLVRRSGIVPFALFCVLFVGLDTAEPLLRRFVYELVGPHPVEWWMPRLPLVSFGVEMVVQMLRICLLATAFNLVMARVTGRTAAKATGPSPQGRPAAPPVSATAEWNAGQPHAR